jgi:hypothetical protein
MADKTDYYTTLKRSMFRRINEVGAKPFLLFQYYLTYASASRINPSLKTVALDMGILDKKGVPQISAVCHLKKELIEAGWIREENGEIFITLQLEKVEKISTPPLRKSQQPIEKISTESLENLNTPLRKSQSLYKDENLKELEIKEKEKELSETDAVASVTPLKKIKVQKSPEQEKFHSALWDYQHAFAKVSSQKLIIANHKALHSLFKLARGDTALCIAIHEDLQTESWRRQRVNWVDVEKDFYNYQNRKNGNGNIQKQSNGNGKPTNSGDRNDQRIANTNAVIAELLQLGEQKSGLSG